MLGSNGLLKVDDCENQGDDNVDGFERDVSDKPHLAGEQFDISDRVHYVTSINLCFPERVNNPFAEELERACGDGKEGGGVP